MENKEEIFDQAPLDPKMFDIDLFSLDIYRDRRSVFDKQTLSSNKLFMIATAGLDFDTELIDWNKNMQLIHALYSNNNLQFEVAEVEHIDDLVKDRYQFEKENIYNVDTNFDLSKLENQKTNYLRTFRTIASKGFYAYDKKTTSDTFELVCFPKYNKEQYQVLLKIISEVYAFNIKDLEKIHFERNNIHFNKMKFIRNKKI